MKLNPNQFSLKKVLVVALLATSGTVFASSYCPTTGPLAANCINFTIYNNTSFTDGGGDSVNAVLNTSKGQSCYSTGSVSPDERSPNFWAPDDSSCAGTLQSLVFNTDSPFYTNTPLTFDLSKVTASAGHGLVLFVTAKAVASSVPGASKYELNVTKGQGVF